MLQLYNKIMRSSESVDSKYEKFVLSRYSRLLLNGMIDK